MKTAATQYPTPHAQAWSSLTVYSDAVMMTRLGGDLRELYGNLADAAQPDHLTRLALLVDQRRAESDDRN